MMILAGVWNRLGTTAWTAGHCHAAAERTPVRDEVSLSTSDLHKLLIDDVDPRNREFLGVRGVTEDDVARLHGKLDAVAPERRQEGHALALAMLRRRHELRQYTTKSVLRDVAEDVALISAIVKPGEPMRGLRDVRQVRSMVYTIERDHDHGQITRRFGLMTTWREPGEPLHDSFDRFKSFRNAIQLRRTSPQDTEALYGIIGENRTFFHDGTLAEAYKSATATLLDTWYHKGHPGEQGLAFMRLALAERRPSERLHDACERLSDCYGATRNLEALASLRARFQKFVDNGGCRDGVTVDTLFDSFRETVRSAQILRGQPTDAETAIRATIASHAKEAPAATRTASEDGWLMIGDLRVPVKRRDGATP